MTNVSIPPEQLEDARRAWRAGRCPCCSYYLISWPGLDGVEYEPEPVAEGVMLCGRCIGNNHHIDPPGFIEALLNGLVEG